MVFNLFGTVMRNHDAEEADPSDGSERTGLLDGHVTPESELVIVPRNQALRHLSF